MRAQRWRAWRGLALAAVAASLGLGLWRNLPWRRVGPREPAWGRPLAALVTAPLPKGRPVALVVGPGLVREGSDRLFFEAVWRRPDVRWVPLPELPPAGGPVWTVRLGSAWSGEAEWRRVWGHGWVTVLRRAEP